MSITRFLTTPCTISTPSNDPADSTVDAEGVPSVVADEVDTVCHLQPVSAVDGNEDLALLGRDEIRRARHAWFPAGTTIRFTSHVTIGSDRYEVAGDPDTWTVGSANDHVAAVLVRVMSNAETAGASS